MLMKKRRNEFQNEPIYHNSRYVPFDTIDRRMRIRENYKNIREHQVGRPPEQDKAVVKQTIEQIIKAIEQ